MNRATMTETNEEIRIAVDGVTLPGELVVPATARGVIVFAHGSGSSRLSSRNRFVASTLRATGAYGTLLFDLLTPAEDTTYANRFDIALLARRLDTATRQLLARADLSEMPIGYFGASTGAAAAIVAAAQAASPVRAVVSRGGRPDLAGDALERLTVPTLLIVGGDDIVVIAMNEQALRAIPAAEKRLDIVPGATHLFEEPGTLEMAAALTRDWFERFLG
jgi:putative phosphoribosyl transferase